MIAHQFIHFLRMIALVLDKPFQQAVQKCAGHFLENKLFQRKGLESIKGYPNIGTSIFGVDSSNIQYYEYMPKKGLCFLGEGVGDLRIKSFDRDCDLYISDAKYRLKFYII